MIRKQLDGRNKTELQDCHQKMDKEATVENSRIGVNAKRLANVGQGTFLRATAPGIGPVVVGKKGESFIFERTIGFENTFIVTPILK